MKINLLLGLILSLSFNVFAQRVIEKPFVESNNTGVYFIDKITLNENATVIECTMNGTKDQRFSIPKGTFIRVEGSKEELHIQSIASPYSLSKRITAKKTGPMKLTLTFPALPIGAKTMDYIEGNKGGTWRLKGIDLTNIPHLSYLPNEFVGDWGTDEKASVWKVSFGKKHIVYEGQLYKDFETIEKKGLYTINLGDKSIYTKYEDDKLYIGENKKDLQACSIFNFRVPQNGVENYPIPGFEMKMDTAYYQGYLANYSPTMDKTGYVAVDNILNHNQEKYLIKVDSSGWFEVKIPTYYPHDVYFRMPGSSNYSAYVVPGDTITQLIKGRSTKSLGKYATFNDEYRIINTLARSYDYRKVQKEIGEMSIDDYKAYCDTVFEKDLKKWTSFCDRLDYNDDIRAIGHRDIKMTYVQNLWSYSMKQSSHARTMQKEGKTYEYAQVDSSFYGIIDDLPIDKEEMISYSNISSVINRIEYANWLSGSVTSTTTTEELLIMLDENGIVLTKEEMQVVEARAKYLESDIMNTFVECTKAYKEAQSAFIQKYMSNIRTFTKTRLKDYPNMGFYTALKLYIEEDSIEISTEELELLTDLILCETEEYLEAKNDFETNILSEYSKINTKYSAFIRQNHRLRRADEKSESFLAYAGERGQLWSDIIMSRALCPNTDKLETLYPSSQKYIVENIQNQFIKDYINYSNEKVKEQIELNKHKTGFNVRTAPKSEGEKFFAEMIEPFKGKVVYVDFWATWCGPCRSGMSQIKPLKEELKGRDDIVFLYITNQTSPEQTYKNMIPDIKGEHYRVSPDQWNYLTTQFGVSGIPHYLLVNKQGEVVNNNDNIRAGYGGLKEKLLKYADE